MSQLSSAGREGAQQPSRWFPAGLMTERRVWKVPCVQGRDWSFGGKGRGERSAPFSISKLFTQLGCSWSGNLFQFDCKAVLIASSSMPRTVPNHFYSTEHLEASRLYG